MTLHLLPPSLLHPSFSVSQASLSFDLTLSYADSWFHFEHGIVRCISFRRACVCEVNFRLCVVFAVYDSTCVSTASAYNKYAHFLHNYKSDAFADFVLRLQFSAAAYAEPCELCVEKEFLFRASLIALCLITRQWRVEIFSLAELFLLPR